MILNIFSDMFTDMVTQYTDSLADHTMEKEIVAEDFSLDPEASWLTAIKKNLANQSLYNNVVKELLNGLLRDKKHFEVDALIENPLWAYQEMRNWTFDSISTFNAFLSCSGQLAG